MVDSGIKTLKNWDAVLKALVISPERALEELNSDWTASQELADELMLKHKLPFRIGHHFASEVVSYAKQNNIKPLDFPYSEAQRIYAEAVHGMDYPQQLPMTEEDFRAALDPIAIVKRRATAGGPQPAEMQRMLASAREDLAAQQTWIDEHRKTIDSALGQLDADFGKLLHEPEAKAAEDSGASPAPASSSK
jgi:argininosuccinate lyase